MTGFGATGEIALRFNCTGILVHGNSLCFSVHLVEFGGITTLIQHSMCTCGFVVCGLLLAVIKFVRGPQKQPTAPQEKKNHPFSWMAEWTFTGACEKQPCIQPMRIGVLQNRTQRIQHCAMEID